MQSIHCTCRRRNHTTQQVRSWRTSLPRFQFIRSRCFLRFVRKARPRASRKHTTENSRAPRSHSSLLVSVLPFSRSRATTLGATTHGVMGLPRRRGLQHQRALASTTLCELRDPIIYTHTTRTHTALCAFGNLTLFAFVSVSFPFCRSHAAALSATAYGVMGRPRWGIHQRALATTLCALREHHSHVQRARTPPSLPSLSAPEISPLLLCFFVALLQILRGRSQRHHTREGRTGTTAEEGRTTPARPRNNNTMRTRASNGRPRPPPQAPMVIAAFTLIV